MKFLSSVIQLACRARRVPISGIIVHATEGHSASSSIEWLKKTGCSYHYIIERNGDIVVCVPKEKVAYHGGNSYGWIEQGKGVSRRQDKSSNFTAGCSVNDYTIGIAFANMDDGEAITDAQLTALGELVDALYTKVPTIRYISTHKWVSPGRKQDPVRWGPDTTYYHGMRVWRGGP